MLDKFQKLFGPNKPSTDVGDIGLAYSTTEAITQKNKAARIASLRRRFFGAIALILALCAVLPWVFEPAEDYSNRGAQTDIPQAQKAPYSQRMPVALKKETKEEPSARAEEVARNLSRANPTPATLQSKDIKDKEKSAVAKTDAKKSSVSKASTVTKAAEKNKTDAKKAQTSASTVKVAQASKVASPSQTSAAAKTNGNLYYIQVVATSNRTSAVEKANRIRKLGLPVYIEKTQRHQADIWRVRVGRFDTLKKANVALDKLALNSISNGGILTEKPTKK